MKRLTDPSHLSRAATFILALLLLAVPLVHSGALFEPFSLPKEIAVLAAALLLGGIGIAARFRPEGVPSFVSAAHLSALALFACAALAVLPALNRSLALADLADLAAGIVIFWSVTRFVRSPSAVALLLQATLAAAALVSIEVVLQVFVPGLNWTLAALSILPPTKAGATLGDAGLASQFLILALPAGIGAAAMSAGRRRRLVAGACLGLIAAALIFAGRPEGWIAGILTLALLVLSRFLQVASSGRLWPRLVPDLGGESLRSVLVALIVVIGVLAVSRWPGLFPSSGPVAPLDGVSLLSPTTGDPASDRAAAARGTLALLGLHPAGIGPGNWRHAFLEVAWTRVPRSPFTLNHQALHAGNDYLERASEYGLLGGTLFVLLLLVLLVQAWLAAARAPAPWDTAGYVAFNVLAVACGCALFGTPFQQPAPALLVWVLAGVTQVALREAGAAPAALRIVWPRERAASVRPPRRRALGIATALWLALAAGMGIWIRERIEASRLTQAALADVYAHRYRAALQTLGQPAARRSSEPLPRAWAGESYLRLGAYDQAAREFGAALVRSPWFIAAYLGRSAAYQAAGRYDLAEQDLSSALAIWPGNTETRMSLARLAATRGQIDEAINQYKAITQSDSGLAEPYFRMGEIFLRRGQIDEAIEAFRVCGMKSPRYPRLQTNLGDAFFKKGLLEMSLRAYQGAASLDEKDVDARLRIANTQHALGRYCDAKESLEAARDLETDPARRDSILDLLKTVDLDCTKLLKSKHGRNG